VITGFNTDVEHEGTVYHVQTEDKGLDSPLILSLVYVGGAILASKRVPYHDLIAEGFDEAMLTERLQRQHKLICAAINAGRIEDLKRMNQRDAVPAKPAAPPAPEPQQETPAPTVQTETLTKVSAPTAQADFGRTSIAPYHELHLDLLEERELRAGDFVTFRIRVSSGAFENKNAVPDADVTLKVLGTAFKPLVCSARTDQDGVAILFAGLPRFSNGRAAILIRAAAHGSEAELRRIIQPA
jgi:hypothetical protein